MNPQKFFSYKNSWFVEK